MCLASSLQGTAIPDKLIELAVSCTDPGRHSCAFLGPSALSQASLPKSLPLKERGPWKGQVPLPWGSSRQGLNAAGGRAVITALPSPSLVEGRA